MTFLGVGAIELLFLSGIAGGLGLATPVTLMLLMLVARDRVVVGTYRIRVALAVAGYVITAVVVLASGIYLGETFASEGVLSLRYTNACHSVRCARSR